MNTQTHPRIASIAGSQIHNPYLTPEASSAGSYLEGAKPHYAQQLELKPIGFGSYWEGRKPRYARLYISQANWLYSVAVQQKTQRS